MSTDRLDSWKQIAAYLKRGVRTVQRWEQDAGLPVRRITTERGAVFAFRSELDAWWRSASVALLADEPRPSASTVVTAQIQPTPSSPQPTRVRSFLSQTIDIDPDSAPAHARLAIYFFTLTAMGQIDPDEGMPAARAAAQRALSLDDANSEAHAITALVAALYEYNWSEAARRFEQALSCQPVSSSTRFHYATWYLPALRRHSAALAQLKMGLHDEPLYLLARLQIAIELFSSGRAAEGMSELQDVLKIDPQFGPALGHLGREYALIDRVDDAMALAERTYAAIPQHPNAVGFLAGMSRRVGDEPRSRDLLDRFAGEKPWASHRAQAESHLVCKDIGATLASIRAANTHRDPGIWILFGGTAGGLLRAAPAWPSLSAELNLPQ